MEQVEILEIPGHQRGIRQARGFVFRGVFGDGQCSGDRFRESPPGQLADVLAEPLRWPTYKVMPKP